MKKSFFSRTIIVITIMLLTQAITMAALDIGVSPSGIAEQSLLPGSQLEKTFIISRSDTTSTTYLAFETSGNASQWLTWSLEKEFFPQGERSNLLVITIDVPENIVLDDYEATFQIRAKMNNEKNIIATELAIPIRMNLGVTNNEVKKYTIVGITVEEHPSGTALPLIFTVINKGNIAAGPSRAQVIIKDQFQKITIEEHDIEVENKIVPFSRETISRPIITTLGEGQYWAYITFYDEQKVLANEKVIFDVQTPIEEQVEERRLGWYIAIAAITIITAFIIRKRQS